MHLYAGDIGAVVGLKDTITGDTLCVEDSHIVFESIDRSCSSDCIPLLNLKIKLIMKRWV